MAPAGKSSAAPPLKYPSGAQNALLGWADALLSLSDDPKKTVKNAQDLYDGAIFSYMLEIIDPEYDASELNENLSLAQSGSDLSGRRRNLHIIHVALLGFARRECPRLELLIQDVKFQSLDKEPSKEGMSQILTLLLCATFWAEDKERYGPVYQKIDQSHLTWLYQLIQTAQARVEAKEKDGPEVEEEPEPVSEDADNDLAREAAISDLQRQVERWKQENADLITRLDHLQEGHDELVRVHGALQEEKEELEKQLESGARDFHDQAARKQQIKELETTIWNTEQELFQAKTRKDMLEKEMERLKILEQQNKDLLDENQILKAEKEEISKKANMADNYKKKLENLKGVESEIKNLRYEKEQLIETLKPYGDAQARLERYKNSEEAYIQRMHQYEQEVAEFNILKAQWTSEVNTLQMRVRELETKSGHDEQMVKELQERIMMLDPSALPSDNLSVVGKHMSLEDELRDSSNDVSMRDLEVSRLQAENSLLKSSIGTETEKGQLLQQIEDVQRSRQSLQEKYNDLFEQHTLGQQQITNLAGGEQDKENALASLRAQFLAEQTRSKQLEQQLEAANTALRDKDRELMDARGDLSAVEKTSQDALAELKNTDSMIAVSLRGELDALRKKRDTLRDDFDAQKSQLITALLDKDQFRRQAEDNSAELQKAAQGPQPASPDAVKTAEKMEKLRVKYKELQKQYETAEKKALDLEKTLKAVRAGSDPGDKKSQLELQIKNLQRENALISTAWYDLTSRLQSNHVVLQRRHDVPKSWVNKQRQIVNATPRR